MCVVLYFDWGDRMNTGERIKTARKQAGLTQKELGKALGVSFQAVAQWETGRRVPKVETIQRIGKALGVSWLWLANPDLTPETFEEAKKGYNDFLIEQRAREHVEKIIEARQDGPFKSLYDFCIRVDGKVLNKRVIESLLKAGAFGSLCGRAQGLLGLDQVLEMAQQRQKDRESGQFSLFDFGGFSDTTDEGVSLPEIAEFTERELLNLEKEFLGLYLSGHPLSSVQDRLKSAISSDIMTCLEAEEDQRVILGGLVTGYRTTVTKKGEMMASFVLEDLTGTIEVLVFPRMFAQVSGLNNDQILIVEGKYNVREEEKKLFAEKIYDLDHLPENRTPHNYLSSANHNKLTGEMKQQAISQPKDNYIQDVSVKENIGLDQRKLFLRFSQEGTPLLEKVLPVLQKYTGSLPVYFYFEENKKVIRSREEFWVGDLEGLIYDLSQIIGKENVAWKVS